MNRQRLFTSPDLDQFTKNVNEFLESHQACIVPGTLVMSVAGTNYGQVYLNSTFDRSYAVVIEWIE